MPDHTFSVTKPLRRVRHCRAEGCIEGFTRDEDKVAFYCITCGGTGSTDLPVPKQKMFPHRHSGVGK